MYEVHQECFQSWVLDFSIHYENNKTEEEKRGNTPLLLESNLCLASCL